MITNIKINNDHHKTIKHIFIAIQCIVKITCISNPDMRGVITCPESIGCFNGCLRLLQITWWLRLWWWWWCHHNDLDDGDELDYDDDIPEDNDKNNEESKPDARNDRSDNPNKTRSRWVRWNQVAINLCCGKLDDSDYDVYKDGIIDDHDLIWPKHDLLWSYSEFFLPHRSDRT